MAPSEKQAAKELTRKLFWAVSSTFPSLTKQERSKTFSWAAEMADRIIDRCHPSLPPTVDNQLSDGYHGQAEGRGGGRYNPSLSRVARPLPPPNLAAWERNQEVMRQRAWAYVLKGRSEGAQLPIPVEVYREVGNGRSNSSS